MDLRRYRRFAEGGIIAVALLLFAAPWLFGVSANADATWVSKWAAVALVLGPVASIGGFPERGATWSLVCGLTAAVAPFVVGFAAVDWAVWLNVGGGLVAAALALPLVGRTGKKVALA